MKYIKYFKENVGYKYVGSSPYRKEKIYITNFDIKYLEKLFAKSKLALTIKKSSPNLDNNWAYIIVEGSSWENKYAHTDIFISKYKNDYFLLEILNTPINFQHADKLTTYKFLCNEIEAVRDFILDVNNNLIDLSSKESPMKEKNVETCEITLSAFKKEPFINREIVDKMIRKIFMEDLKNHKLEINYTPNDKSSLNLEGDYLVLKNIFRFLKDRNIEYTSGGLFC